jgi:hypothetical protein
MTLEQFILEYIPVVIVMGLTAYLFALTIGRLMDRATRRREAIRSEAEKHMDKIMDGRE